MMVKVEFDGKLKEIEPGTKISDLAGENALAAMVDGRPVDLSFQINGPAKIELIDFSSDVGKRIYWHSSSHVMAMAVKALYPDAQLAIGPAIDQGFYYDFGVSQPFNPDDLKRIEAKMQEFIAKDLPFERSVMKKDALIEFFGRRNEAYKVELVRELPDEEVSIYRNGDFVDLCRGPHLPRTGLIHAFKLLSIAGAYWRGDASNAMLSRIYGISYPTAKELEGYLKRLEEAARRDHRKLGTELDLFSIHEEAGGGLVFWHPKGTILKRTVEDYWIAEHLAAGYELVSTPHIARANLWRQSGHMDFYRDKMFTLPVENEEYVLKPMNCPGHILIYKSKVRSYRELPIKYAELGTVYRNELSGTLHGLLRVRGFTQDDAHVFCTPQQIEDEIVKILELTIKMFKRFGFHDYQVDLSVRDLRVRDKYLGTDEEWERAEAGLVSALHRLALPYHREEGEAVFYGPKIDIKILDALGRPWQATTVQFDFNLPRRFRIQYMDQEGKHQDVVVIHRALYGSLERFLGTLIEHYGGAFPLWLAPVQLMVMPITDKEARAAVEVFEKCRTRGYRVEMNDKSTKINYRIREAETRKIPYSLILGAREAKNKTVSVRKRGRGDIGEMKLKEFFSLVENETGGNN